MIPLLHRAGLLVAEYGLQLAIALALVGALALGGAAWTYTHPPTEQVTERTHVQTISTGVDTRAYVASENRLWEQGTWLENGTVYPVAAAPNLTLRVRTDVPDGTEVEVDHSVVVVYRATRDGTTFWEETEPVSEVGETTDDGRVVTTTEVDVRAVRTNLSRLNDDLTGLGRASASVQLTVSYATDRYEGTITRSTPLTFAGDGYWLGGSLSAKERHGTPVVREVPAEPDEAVAGSLALLGLLGLSGALAVTIVHRRGIDRAAAREGVERSRYAEWVSTGRLRQAISGQDVPMATLRDLVNLAIDAKLRVIHDPERDLYAVISAGVIYYYDPADPRDEVTSSLVDPPTDVGLAVSGDGGREPGMYLGQFDYVSEATELEAGDRDSRAGEDESDEHRSHGDGSDHDSWVQLLEDSP